MSKPKQATSWRDTIPVHPAADLFPLMSAEMLAELRGDYKRQGGFILPIVLWSDRTDDESEDIPLVYLLDGRNRLDAMGAAEVTYGPPGSKYPCWRVLDAEGREIATENPDLGEPPPLLVLDGDEIDPWAYVISANVCRRNLTSAQKRELVAALLKANPEQSNRQIAEATKTSHPHVAKVRLELEQAGDVETFHVYRHQGPPPAAPQGQEAEGRQCQRRVWQ